MRELYEYCKMNGHTRDYIQYVFEGIYSMLEPDVFFCIDKREKSSYNAIFDFESYIIGLWTILTMKCNKNCITEDAWKVWIELEKDLSAFLNERIEKSIGMLPGWYSYFKFYDRYHGIFLMGDEKIIMACEFPDNPL